MPMRFIESRSGYSVYEDRGERVYRRDMTWLDRWTKNHVRWEHTDRTHLTVEMAVDAADHDDLTLEETRALVSENATFEVTACEVCDDVIATGNSCTVDGDTWCEDCVGNHTVVECAACNEQVSDRNRSIHLIEDVDNYCCSDCYDHGEAYYCDTHYRFYWADNGCSRCEEEDGDCCCESPEMNFSIAGVGATGSTVRLASGENHMIHADDGIVSQSGYERILVEVRRWLTEQFPGVEGHHVYRCQCDITDPVTKAGHDANVKHHAIRDAAHVVTALWRWDPSYRSADGVPFAKRVRAEIYQRTKNAGHAVSLPSDLLSKIGTIARENSEGVDTLVDITRDLNMDASDFVHDESCWWTDYAYSRCTLKNNAGFGLRTFSDGPSNYATGRAWVFPCTVEDNGRLKPTFGEAEAYVVFNGYGDLSEYRGARVLATMTGWSARPETLDMTGVGELMYVNSGSARVVAPGEVLKRDDLYFSGAGMTRH